MRIIKKPLHSSLTETQRYFVECWFNMVHEHSLDSFRVRAMNARNILREIVRILERGQSDERKAVYEEACLILRSDPIMQQPQLASACQQLVDQLTRSIKAVEKKDGDRADENFLRYFIAEMAAVVDDCYLAVALSWIQEKTTTSTVQVDESSLKDLHSVVNNLLSTLIDHGTSLEALYSLYSQVLSHNRRATSYRFDRRLDLLKKLLTGRVPARRIALVLDNISDVNAFPTELGGFTFVDSLPFALRKASQERSYKSFQSAPKRLFALTDGQQEGDVRAAGANANDRLNQILNLVRFEYERSSLSVGSEFAVLEPEKQAEGRTFQLPTLVPNPISVLSEVPVAEFVKSVNALVDSNRFSREGQERIQAAFRLYRIGLDTPLLEQKLINWWTALEYLVRGGDPQGGIGKSVENAVVPVLCLRYIGKQIAALRHVLLDKSISLCMSNAQPVILRDADFVTLFDCFQRKEAHMAVDEALQSSPYCRRHARLLLEGIGSGKGLIAMIAPHEQRVRWQIMRLYRTRCDIVHSAERTVSGGLLCANLEFYLKSTLVALLQALRKYPTLSSPKEFFDRQSYAYQRLQMSLKEDRIDMIRESLMS